MEPRYNHQEAEGRIYKTWEDGGFFNPDTCIEKGYTAPDAEPFSIVLPPPNVTGTLHIGHAYEDTLQDIAVRYARMQGKRTLWVPGTDHAAIATQSKVEKELSKSEKRSRHDLGREEFLKRVNDFARESHDTIVRQVRRLGASLDWSREAYTLDEKRSRGVRTAFTTMYDLGLIYRGNRIVNWDPKGQTVISDDEIVYEERKAKLYTFRYDKNFPIAIATTRLETKFGDTAVAVNPTDERYKQFVGKEYDAVFCGAKIHIKVVADDSVEKEFGTGALGVTPAHSTIDWEIAERHNLPHVQVINEYAKMSVEGPVNGKKTEEAREWVAEELRKQGLIEKEEEITQNVSTAERTGAVIEPLPKLQWFVAVNKPFKRGLFKKTTLKKMMRDAVESGKVHITPERFEKIYFHWIDNLRDWCISRQIWFGHRIPAFYDATDPKNENGLVRFSKIGQLPEISKHLTINLDEQELEEELTKHGGNYARINNSLIYAQFKHLKALVNRGAITWEDIKRHATEVYTSDCLAPRISIENIKEDQIFQDPDTLDTWFSSALWPFSTLGWPEKTKDFETYFPNSLMAPGYEILFLWVARMILMSGVLLDTVPFHAALIHGIVRDSKGEKFSKSKGNGIDPLLLADTYGADAVRMSLIAGAPVGSDVKFDEQRVKGYRNFATKIWNIARFIEMNKPEYRKNGNPVPDISNRAEAQELAALKKEITAHLDTYELHLAAEKLYHYIWHTLADRLVEQEKSKLRDGNTAEKAESYALLEHLLLESLKMLHPFMPYVTEEIYGIFRPGKMLIVDRW